MTPATSATRHFRRLTHDQERALATVERRDIGSHYMPKPLIQVNLGDKARSPAQVLSARDPDELVPGTKMEFKVMAATGTESIRRASH